MGKCYWFGFCLLAIAINLYVIFPIDSYEMLTNDDIANTPVARWTGVDQTLVAIWCTNAPSTIQAIREQFLAKWQLKLLATWFWIKVRSCRSRRRFYHHFPPKCFQFFFFVSIQITKYGETICDFDLPLKKQPFERIFIACHIDSMHEFNIPDEKLLFSVPSAIHSHKPPLHGSPNKTFRFIFDLWPFLFIQQFFFIFVFRLVTAVSRRERHGAFVARVIRSVSGAKLYIGRFGGFKITEFTIVPQKLTEKYIYIYCR